MVCVFSGFDLLNKMTLEETRVDTPKSVWFHADMKNHLWKKAENWN